MSLEMGNSPVVVSATAELVTGEIAAEGLGCVG
jgi:hypothetical protein